MTTLRIDLVSDVVCPWCYLGARRLMQALEHTRVNYELHWQPFQLNPDMDDAGQDLQEHLSAKYGSTVRQSAEIRGRLTGLGEAVGAAFNFYPQMRIYNTRQAHELLAWAAEQGGQTELAMVLFAAYFEQEKALNEPQVLLDAAAQAGLDVTEAAQVLASGRYQAKVEEQSQFWPQQGINGVPAFIFQNKYLVSGAQEVDSLIQVLEQLREEIA